MRQYSNCFSCGGEVEEQRMPRELMWEDKLFVLEDVPVGVCQQCGGKFLKPEVAKTIDRILREEKEPLRIPELKSIGEALAAHREGRPVTARCPTCEGPLHVEEIKAVGSIWVLCSNGCTRAHFKVEPEALQKS